MSEAWIAAGSAVLTGLFSLLGVYIANRKSAGIIEFRIKELEKKVEKHNNLLDRMTAVEVKVKDMESDISDIKKKVG